MAISLFLMGVWNGFHCSSALSFGCLGSKQDEKEKWMRCMGKRLLHCGGGVLQLLLQLWECLNVCLLWSEWWCHTGGRRRRRRWGITKYERDLLSVQWRSSVLHVAVTQAATALANCDHFSIHISYLASELIFKPPPHPNITVIRYTYLL